MSRSGSGSSRASPLQVSTLEAISREINKESEPTRIVVSPKPKNILIPVISFLSQIIVVNNVAIVKKRFLDVERNLQFLRLRINKKCLTLYFLMNVCWENSAPP